MIVHIFTSEGLYPDSFLRFYEKHFPLEDRLFVFRSKPSGKYIYSSKLKSHIVYIDNSSKFLSKLLLKLIAAEKIFIHYFPVGPSLYLWYSLGFLLKKATWIIWGGDLYYFQNSEKTLKTHIYEFLRKGALKNIRRIACFIKGDFELAKKIYSPDAKYTYVCYLIPTDFDYLETLEFKSEGSANSHKVLVGNSASKSNNHYEIIEKLSSYKDIEIVCPLSYGNVNGYAENLIDYSKSIYGERFIPVVEMMEPKEYSNLLNDIDVAVMNHSRQQGLGNVLSLLYLGKKVYLRKDTTPFSYFESIGVRIFDTLEIEKEDPQSLFEFPDEDRKRNREIIKKEFSEENYIRLWTNVLEGD